MVSLRHRERDNNNISQHDVHYQQMAIKLSYQYRLWNYIISSHYTNKQILCSMFGNIWICWDSTITIDICKEPNVHIHMLIISTAREHWMGELLTLIGGNPIHFYPVKTELYIIDWYDSYGVYVPHKINIVHWETGSTSLVWLLSIPRGCCKPKKSTVARPRFNIVSDVLS